MKISALAPWFGSKRTLAPKIVQQLGPHRAYWEPFCGSMAVLLAKEQSGYESVNDLHKDLVNLAIVLKDRDTAEDLYGRAHRTLFTEDLCRESKSHLNETTEAGDVDRAYWYLVFSWFGVNGTSGTPLSNTGSFCVRFTSKGGNGPVRWRSVVDSIPDWHERLLRVQITNRDGFELLEEIEDSEGTVIYADPPYLVKGAKYLHDFTSEDHGRLAQLLARFQKTRVVVSYYAHPRLAELYPGWELVNCAMAKSLVNSGKRDDTGRTEAPEVLLINRRIASETPQALYQE